MRPSRPLSLERLEDRCVPVTWGNPWPDGQHLSLSFAPDGTAVGGRTSELFASLNATAPTADWQREALRAFQTWAVHANLNIGLVPDSGDPFGASGRPQGDSRFGDVRLAGYRMSPEVMAIASPFESTAGTWAGDVKLNTAYTFGAGGIDLYTALLHEAAHVFGLDHSPDPASAVHAHYLGPKSGLGADDVARLQELYGARAPDAHEGYWGNGSRGSATPLNILSNPDGSLGLRTTGDVTTLGDVDFYKFRAPLNLGTFDVRLKTSGLSLLTGKITVLDQYGRVVGSAKAGDPLVNQDLTVRVKSSGLFPTYYLRVEGARGDVFGIGGYELEVKSLPLLGTLTGLVDSTTDLALSLLNDDLHTDDTFLTASLLPPLGTQTASQFDYAFRGSIRDSYDVDLYKVRAPAPGQGDVLSVMVWGLENGGLMPRVRVYDAAANPVEAEVLVNEAGIFTVQVEGVTAGADYFVKVEAADPGGPNNVGNYFLGIDAGPRAVGLLDLGEGTLGSDRPAVARTMTLGRSEMRHFVLSAEGGTGGVRLVVTDAGGREVAVLTALAGQDPASLTVTLGAGTYQVRLEAAGAAAESSVGYRLKGSRLSDPIGPYAEDTTEEPSGTPTYSEPTETNETQSEESWWTSEPPTEETTEETTTTAEPTTDSGTETSSGDGWETWNGDSRGLSEEEEPCDPYTI